MLRLTPHTSFEEHPPTLFAEWQIKQYILKWLLHVKTKIKNNPDEFSMTFHTA
jgi:hypothetical protein